MRRKILTSIIFIGLIFGIIVGAISSNSTFINNGNMHCNVNADSGSDLSRQLNFPNNYKDNMNFLEITKPLKGYLYVFNMEIIPIPIYLFNVTIIIGPITIRARAEGFIPLSGVDFYINSIWKIKDIIPPYQYTWAKPAFGLHKIEATATDITLDEHLDSLWVFKLY